MLKRLPSWLPVLCLFVPSLVLASICDDINYIANGWNEMANIIHSADVDQLSDADLNAVDQGITEAYDGTTQFATALVDYGNADEVALGENLTYALEDLWNTQGGTVEELIYAMDGVVDSLDHITDYCDMQ